MSETSVRNYALTEEQVRRYVEDGYLHLKGVWSRGEAAQLRREAHELMERLTRHQEIDATWGSTRMTGDATRTKLLHCHNVQFQSAMLTHLLVDPVWLIPLPI